MSNTHFAFQNSPSSLKRIREINEIVVSSQELQNGWPGYLTIAVLWTMFVSLYNEILYLQFLQIGKFVETFLS